MKQRMPAITKPTPQRLILSPPPPIIVIAKQITPVTKATAAAITNSSLNEFSFEANFCPQAAFATWLKINAKTLQGGVPI